MSNAARTDPKKHRGWAPHPAFAHIAERRAADVQLRLADAITKFAGSMIFVYIHAVLFAVWMLAVESNPWPTLTLVVSLEAIFLSTFVLISQNRGTERDMEREEDDLRLSVLTGAWVEQIGDKLGVHREEVEQTAHDRLRDDHDR
jgi:uncharacterized membrane protein